MIRMTIKEEVDAKIEKYDNKIAWYELKKRKLITRYNELMDEGLIKE